VCANRADIASSERRHVLLVVRWPVGGIRTFLKYVISYFPSDKYRFSVIGVSTEGMGALKEELGDLVERWVLVPPEGKVVPELLVQTRLLYRQHRFDAVHAHGFTSVIACLFLGLTSRARLICTSHDVLNHQQLSGPKGWVRRAILGAALARCRVVHSVSYDAEANLLSEFPSLKAKSRVITNGIDVALFSTAQPVDLREAHGISPDVKIVGFFGRFMGQKGFKYLIGAIESLERRDDVPAFHVICFGSGAFIREEQIEIRRRGLESLFTFSPFIPDVSGAMKGCDLIAMPSLWEACPLQPMEALCAGVPFVGTDCIGMREVLSNTPATVVKSGDTIALADGMLECLELGREPFEAFSAKAKERFDVRRTASSVYEMYEKVLT